MSDYELKRINALTEASAINDSDVFAIDSAAGTKKVAWEMLKGEVDADISEAVSNKADKDGTYPDMAVGSVLGTNTVTDREPYFLRPSASIGDREFDTLVGGSLGWNQLCNGSSVTVESGHKYYMIKGGTGSVGASDGTAITGLTSGTDIVIDLTTTFGSTIADYIYSLETAHAGDGVAWVRRYLTEECYAYCAPTLKHVTGVSAHVMTGFNQFDVATQLVDGVHINNTTGEAVSGANRASTDYVPVIGGEAYYINTPQTGGAWGAWYDSDKQYISGITGYAVGGAGRLQTAPDNARYMRLTLVYNSIGDPNAVCINLSDASKNGTYEPYETHSYPIDSTWVGMGIPKLDSANKLYFDGDTYASDGTVTNKFVEITITGDSISTYGTASSGNKYVSGDLSINGQDNLNKIASRYAPSTNALNDKAIRTNNTGFYIYDNTFTDLASAKAALNANPVKLVYERTAPTTSTASPFTNPQICDPNGTEEYVTTGLVPVGHETEYVENLADKLTDIPDLPTTAGTYSLKVTVSGGVPSYSWVSA